MIDLPRSMLFVSGERPDRFSKAFATDADVVCIDLEDAVPPAGKAAARAAALKFAGQARTGGGPDLALRLNALGTNEGLLDLLALGEAGVALDYLLVPKVEFARDLVLITTWASRSFRSLVALVETPLGVENAHSIASAVSGGAPQLAALMLGGADLSAELGAAFEWTGLLSARGRLVNAARASGLQAWDVPCIETGDMAGLQAETASVLRMGYSCKAAIHPKQIGTIHEAFEPSAEQAQWARDVLQAHAERGAAQASGAFLHNGKMIDAPVIRNARRIAERASRGAAQSAHSQQMTDQP